MRAFAFLVPIVLLATACEDPVDVELVLGESARGATYQLLVYRTDNVCSSYSLTEEDIPALGAPLYDAAVPGPAIGELDGGHHLFVVIGRDPDTCQVTHFGCADVQGDAEGTVRLTVEGYDGPAVDCPSGTGCQAGACVSDAVDAGLDAGVDGGSDGGSDVGLDGAVDGGPDGGLDAGPDAGFDDGSDGGTDGGPPPDPLAECSDEFEGGTVDPQWTSLTETEGSYEVTGGELVLLPEPGGWFGSRTGMLLHKGIEGGFLAETQVIAESRSGGEGVAPMEENNVGGLIIRAGGAPEDWFLVDVGAQNTTSQIGARVKNTVDGSTSTTFHAGAFSARLRICRVGSSVQAARFNGTTWDVLDGNVRTDLPDTVQVGPMATAWNSGGGTPDDSVDPDVRARFAYVRFQTIASIEECTTAE